MVCVVGGATHTAFLAALLWLHTSLFGGYLMYAVYTSVWPAAERALPQALLFASQGLLVLSLPAAYAAAAGGLCSFLLFLLFFGGPQARPPP
jgi:hypothetical protein